MDIKWLGTATVIVRDGDDSLLFDPFISMNEQIRGFFPEDAEGIGDILITHGHFDHLVDVPMLINKYNQKVHCSAVAAETLKKSGVSTENIHTVGHGDSFNIGSFKVNVMKGRHIKFDLKLIRKTLINPRIIKYRKNLRKIAKANRKFPEGEVLVFDIECKGKRVMALGSLNLAKSVKYPQNADLLMIPFQGRSDINKYVVRFIKRLKPKQVYMHHFDDTFPPVSSAVNIKPFLKRMKKRFPHIKVIVPEYGKSIKL